jgi:spermidine synthase
MKRMGSRRQLVAGCLLLSGASALIYEIVWLRQINLIVGTTTGAVSTVLAVFMLGLGLGARWLGAWADRSRSPLRLYAYLELGIALYALALPRLMAAATPAYVAFARSLTEHPGWIVALRVALGFALLLVPTVLMGATLPVLVRFGERDVVRFGRDVGTLYAVNLGGAMLGCVATGFVLIRFLGVRGATLVAVLLNLAAALAALLWSLRDRGDGEAIAPESQPSPAASLTPPALRPLLWGVVLASGFSSMAFEVLWTRILVFSFQSTVYAFTVILATFLGGLALGSWLFARIEARVPPLALLAGAQLLAGISALLLAPLATRPGLLMDALARWAGGSPLVWVAGMAAGAVLTMLLPATLMGAVFPVGMKLLVLDLRHAGRRVGAAYLANTLGCVAGSLIAGFALIPALGLKGSLVALCAFQATLGALFIPALGLPLRRTLAALAGAAAVVLLAIAVVLRALPGPNPFDHLVPRIAEVEAHRDDATASVSVLRYPRGNRALRIDGFEATADSSAAGYMAMMTHIPMLLHPDPKRLLVICFGTGRTAGTGLLYPGTSIDVVDVNPAVIGFAPFFRVSNRAIAENPRARLIVDDGRNFLLSTREQYDVITAEPMPPNFAGVVNLYSREYYELAREHLAPGGLVVQWLPMHLLTVSESLAVVKTMQELFPETSLWIHGATGIVVSRKEAPLVIQVTTVGQRLADPAIAADVARFGVGGILPFVNLFTLDAASLVRLTAGVRAVTDDAPSLEFHSVTRRSQELTAGGFSADALPFLELALIGRQAVQVPLAAEPADLVADLRKGHAAAAFSVLGDLYLDAGRPDLARARYVAGVERAARPRDRALFLFALAQLARAEGQLEEAWRLLGEGLGEWPDNAPALELRRQLEAQRRDAHADTRD